MKSLIESKGILGSPTFSELIQKHVNNLSSDPNYIYRVTASLFVREMEGLERT